MPCRFEGLRADGAAEKGSYEVVKVLLEHGANCNWKKLDGTTPLYFATVQGKVDVMKLLLEYKADVFASTTLGSTMLHAAGDTVSI